MAEPAGNNLLPFVRRLAEAEEKTAPSKPIETGGGGHDSGGMDGLQGLEVRVGKIETAIDGLRHAQTMVLGVLVLGLSTLLGAHDLFWPGHRRRGP
jgi:hypothetical protein